MKQSGSVRPSKAGYKSLRRMARVDAKVGLFIPNSKSLSAAFAQFILDGEIIQGDLQDSKRLHEFPPNVARDPS